MLSELANINDRRMTLKEIAEHTGAAYRTVADYAQRAGWTENGKQTLLDERQVTLILEAMKQAHHNQTKDTLQATLQGVETSQSRAIRIAVLSQRQKEIDRQIQIELETEIAELKAKIEADRHKTVMFDQCMESGSLMSISTMAKKLARLGLGPRKIFAFLRDRKIILRNHAGYWVPYQPYIDRGFFEVKQEPRQQGARTVIDDITRVTQRGYAFVLEMVNEAYPIEATA